MIIRTILCIFFFQALALVACQPSASSGQHHEEAQQSSSAPAQKSREWKAATFQGLTMGKSTRADMLKQLGKPEGSSPYNEGKDGSGLLYEYKANGDLPGVIVVAVDNRRNLILHINLEPQGWSKEQAINHFGNDYVVTRYDFDDCLGDGESAPLYESPNGSIPRIEYRSRGIALAVNDEGKIDYVMYVSEPVGSPSSKCKGNNDQKFRQEQVR
jgi:hypothetical protein